MNRITSMTGVVLLLAGALAGTCAAAEDTVADLEAKKQALERGELRELRRELRDLKNEVARKEEVAKLREDLETTKAALEAKLAADEAVAQAMKQAQEAETAWRQAQGKVVGADPTARQIAERIREVRAQVSQADLNRRLGEFILENYRRRYADSVDMRQVTQQQQAAQQALQQALQDPEVAALVRARDEAKQALEAKVRTLPEFAAAREAEQALKARVEVDQEITEAEKAVADARVAYNKRLAEVLGSDPQAGPHMERYRQAIGTIQQGQAALKQLDAQLREAGNAAAAKDPEVQKARELYDEARQAYLGLANKGTEAERKAMAEARDALNAKIDAMVAGDTRGAEIVAKIKDLEKQVEALNERIKELKKTGEEAAPKG